MPTERSRSNRPGPVRTTSPSSAYCRTWRVEQLSQRATVAASTESSTGVTVFFAIPPPSAMRVRLLIVQWIVSSYARRATRLVPGCQSKFDR